MANKNYQMKLMLRRLVEFWQFHRRDLTGVGLVLLALTPVIAIPFILLPSGTLTQQVEHNAELLSFTPTQAPKVITGTRPATAKLENGRFVTIDLPINGAYKRADEIRVMERKHKYGPYRYYALTD